MTETGKRRHLRVVVVDDEPLARRYLGELLAVMDGVEIVGTCRNGFEAVETISTVHPDVVFLDIQMPGLDGFEVLEALGTDAPEIVFVTAYDAYAIRAFEVHAVDYLLKPFSDERLETAMERLRQGGNSPVSGGDIARAARPSAFLERLVIRDGATVSVIPTVDVDYIAAETDYVAVHAKGVTWLKLQTLSSMATSLDPATFVRIHRSTILNIQRLVRIKCVSKDVRVAVLKDGTELPVSKTGYQALKDALGE